MPASPFHRWVGAWRHAPTFSVMMAIKFQETKGASGHSAGAHYWSSDRQSGSARRIPRFYDNVNTSKCSPWCSKLSGPEKGSRRVARVLREFIFHPKLTESSNLLGLLPWRKILASMTTSLWQSFYGPISPIIGLIVFTSVGFFFFFFFFFFKFTHSKRWRTTHIVILCLASSCEWNIWQKRRPGQIVSKSHSITWQTNQSKIIQGKTSDWEYHCWKKNKKQKNKQNFQAFMDYLAACSSFPWLIRVENRPEAPSNWNRTMCSFTGGVRHVHANKRN